MNFIRPGVFGSISEKDFEKEYVDPISKGMASDASNLDYLKSLETSEKLEQLLRPYVHRVDVSELQKELPPLQQVVLHVRQSRLQSRMYQFYKSLKKSDDKYNNFFTNWQDLRQVNNHPGTLLFTSNQARAQKKKTKVINGTTDEEEDSDENNENPWWNPFLLNEGEKMKDIPNGYKIVLLLHILAYAQKCNEKVLIFTESRSTLDYVEYVLALEDWTRHVPSLHTSDFPGKVFDEYLLHAFHRLVFVAFFFFFVFLTFYHVFGLSIQVQSWAAGRNLSTILESTVQTMLQSVAISLNNSMIRTLQIM